MSRECPEPRKESRSTRGGFNAGSNDRGGGFRPPASNGGGTFRDSRNQGDSSESKPTFTGWRGGAGATSTSNNNDSDEANKRPAFGGSTTRGSFTNSGSGFRGNQISFY
jgi:hypothetical protein